MGAQLGGYLHMCALAITGLPAPTQIALALDLAENFLLLQTDLFGNQIGSNFFFAHVKMSHVALQLLQKNLESELYRSYTERVRGVG